MLISGLIAYCYLPKNSSIDFFGQTLNTFPFISISTIYNPPLSNYSEQIPAIF